MYMQTYLFYELLIYNFFQQLNIIIKVNISHQYQLSCYICYMIWIYRVTVLDLGITHMTECYTFVFILCNISKDSYFSLFTFKESHPRETLCELLC